MARLNLPSPTAYSGQTATTKQAGAVRFGTSAEVAAGVMKTVCVSPYDLATATAADLSSPTPIGNTTPNTGAFTTLAATGTVGINVSGAAVTTIGTGGTGAVAIGNATGNTAVTGSLTASTTLTATSGAITATSGNFVSSAAGNGLLFNANTATGAAASPVVLNSRAGQVVFSSVSIAAAADLTLTITNSAITGASTQVIYSMSGATTGSALSIKSVTNSAGSSAIVVTNGTGASTTTADIKMTFLVIN